MSNDPPHTDGEVSYKDNPKTEDMQNEMTRQTRSSCTL